MMSPSLLSSPFRPTAPCLGLLGPTAAGKSEVALLLAERLNGEIVTVDSMQVYRGLDLGTAKAGAAERARVTHHLLDVVDLHEPFDAARFVALAREAVGQIHSRGRLPILCGGTGLYLKALLHGLGEAPPGDPLVRAELESVPLQALCEELEAGDPVTFGRIDRRNRRRVVRAVEILRVTHRPLVRAAPAGAGAADSPALSAWIGLFALLPAMAELRFRIDKRVEAMFDRGLVAETEGLLQRGLERNPTALQAIGYRQVVEHLRGMRSFPDTVALVKNRTWQFARRQLTWLRHQLPVTWVPWEPGVSAGQIADRIETLFAASEAARRERI